MNARLETVDFTLKDLLGDLPFVHHMEKLYRPVRMNLKIEIPNWMVENEEIDLVHITRAGFRKQVRDFMSQLPAKWGRTVKMYYRDASMAIDACSQYCFDSNITCIYVNFDAYCSNVKGGWGEDLKLSESYRKRGYNDNIRYKGL